MPPASHDSPQPFDLLARAADLNPGAVLIDDGATRVAYGEALRLSRRVAHGLRSRGIRPGDRLILDLPPGLAALLTLSGFHEAVVVTSAVQPARPRAAGEWLVTTTGSSDHSTVVIDTAFLADLGDPPPGFVPRRYSGGDSVVKVVFSSGTTGVPKGVPLTLDMAHHRARAARALVVPGEGFLCTLGLGSSSGFHTFFDAIATGSTYLAPGLAAHNLDLVRRYRVASIKASPVQISELCDAIDSSGETVPFLRTLYSAGATMPSSVREKVRRVTSATVINLYGSTEAGRAAERVLDDNDLEWVGTVVPGTELEIVDDDHRPLPVGRVGTVRYRRAHQATGYEDAALESSQAFRDGWFYPGDRGALSETGELRLAGRASDLVNAGGVKIDPIESETAALATGLVDEAAGFGFSDADGLTQLGLAVVGGSPGNLGTLNTALQRDLAARAPRALFRVPTLPRTESGKVRRSELQRLYETAIGQSSEPSP